MNAVGHIIGANAMRKLKNAFHYSARAVRNIDDSYWHSKHDLAMLAVGFGFKFGSPCCHV